MSEAFLMIVNMSISASWLVLVVLVLRFLLKKAPKWVNVLLWGLVAVRLICPFSIESAMSLIPSAEVFSPTVLIETPEINTGIPVVNNAVNPIIQDAVITLAPEKNMTAMKFLIQLISQIWTVGVVLLLVYSAVSFWRLRRKMSTAVILRHSIFQSEFADSPFVLGLVKPRIYLPYGMDEQSMTHVIAHEQAHIRRKDHWWKPLGFLLLTVHWFNPLMWMAYILLCRDIELACDEKVIKELGNSQRADYTQALVHCSVNRRMITACPLAFGEVGVKQRVRSIMNYRKPTFWIMVTAVIACIAVAVCFLTDPKEISTPEPIMDALSSDEVAWAQVTLWENATEHISLNEAQIQELIRILNNLDESDFVRSKVPEHNLSLMIYCGPSKEILLHWDGDYTWFTFHSEMLKGIDVDYCYVNSQTLNLFLSQFYEKTILYAKLLALEDKHFIVEPITGSPELNSASRIMVPMRNMAPSPEPVVGDILQIEYDGMLQETYPARITNVYHISVTHRTGDDYEPAGCSGDHVIELYDTPDNMHWEDGLGFGGLAPGEEAVSDFEIRIDEDATPLILTITWARQSLVLEYGIRAEDGTEYSQEKRGGASILQISDIPAGVYHLFVRNCDVYHGIPSYEDPDKFKDVSFDATGALIYAFDQ
ncbi:MAG: M56 family metallopeptidase [Oscillospiraceae bacterium]|nr:M56 family metallopeptidase [Oscillospiraceae bacterium]